MVAKTVPVAPLGDPKVWAADSFVGTELCFLSEQPYPINSAATPTTINAFIRESP